MLKWAYSHINSGDVKMFKEILFTGHFWKSIYRAIKNSEKRFPVKISELIIFILNNIVKKNLLGGIKICF